MDLDKQKAFKLVIVVLATLAALAVMSTLVQLIQTILPFLIVGIGIYAGYRWALGDAPAPTADEVEEQARGLFSRFRRGKKAVETTMKVGDALNDMAEAAERKPRRRRRTSKAAEAEASTDAEASPEAPVAEEAGDANEREEKVSRMKESLDSNPKGAVEFNDRDVVISADDVVQPDISRLQEKEKEVPKVTNNVLAQIEERRRRLEGGD
ncbi:MAG: hypothetical protein OXG85_01365 [Chloroflexi bacterium]|nr:hypothetical protein [Chloroflexota bacterium]